MALPRCSPISRTANVSTRRTMSLSELTGRSGPPIHRGDSPSRTRFPVTGSIDSTPRRAKSPSYTSTWRCPTALSSRPMLTSGFVAAIPVLTRGLLFSLGRGQLGYLKGSNQLAPVGPMFYASLGMFAGVFLLSLKGRRFWCRYVCPSGAMLSVFNFFRVGERKVESSCINCNKCVEICPFDAIEEDFTTRESDCTYCQSCGGACRPRGTRGTGVLRLCDRRDEHDSGTLRGCRKMHRVWHLYLPLPHTVCRAGRTAQRSCHYDRCRKRTSTSTFSERAGTTGKAEHLTDGWVSSLGLGSEGSEGSEVSEVSEVSEGWKDGR